MGLLSRWSRPPAEFRALLAAHERVLGTTGPGQLDADQPRSEPLVVVTQLGLWLPTVPVVSDARTTPDGASWRRIGWDRIVKATWNDGVLDVVEGDRDEDGLVADLAAVRIAMIEPRNVPSVVRTRVETSIARTEQVQVPDGTGRVVARRVPGVDGLTWTARLDVGTPATPDSLAVLRRYLEQIASSARESAALAE